MAGLHIHTNIQRVIDIVSYVNESNTKAVIISIDFEQCFDRVEHRSIFAALYYFGFGPKFIYAMSIFFNDLEICTQNAAFLSKWFQRAVA